MLKNTTLLLFLAFCLSSFAQKSIISRVDPPFWFTGMNNNKVQLLLHAPCMNDYSIQLNSESSFIQDIHRPSNKEYCFVTVAIGADQQAGHLEFVLTDKKGKKSTWLYLLTDKKERKRGIDPNDFIYVLFPDRFANGNPANDVVSGMLEKTVDRKGLKTRHGGDLKGVSQRLDYIKELGITALWINPVLENNQPYESYHGYAATDLYKIDPRFGSNEEYVALVEQCHNSNMKVIMDVVYNHWGNEHHLFKNLPDSNWVHWFGEFTRTNYRAETLMDPYASEYDKNIMSNAWFDHHMPDLNQQDPYLATYLIQNSIWWIAHAGIDAFRIDTYAYPDQVFMKQLNEAVLHEFPDFMLFGETWVQGSTVQAWFTGENTIAPNFNSSLHGVTDFQLYYAITKGLVENFGWEEGFRRIEMTLGHDLIYKDPYMNVTFLDNHDLSRYYSMVNEDFDRWKMGIALMMTLRGIPSIYYGTELLMTGYSNPDALVRADFPGGWAADSLNLFKAENRKGKQKEAFDFIQQLASWRMENKWFGRSALKQFVPENNTYVYIRSEGDKKLLCAYNLNDKEAVLPADRFAEAIKGYQTGISILDGRTLSIEQNITIPAKSFLLLELTAQ
jgi:neopullulanase